MESLRRERELSSGRVSLPTPRLAPADDAHRRQPPLPALSKRSSPSLSSPASSSSSSPSLSPSISSSTATFTTKRKLTPVDQLSKGTFLCCACVSHNSCHRSEQRRCRLLAQWRCCLCAQRQRVCLTFDRFGRRDEAHVNGRDQHSRASRSLMKGDSTLILGLRRSYDDSMTWFCLYSLSGCMAHVSLPHRCQSETT